MWLTAKHLPQQSAVGVDVGMITELDGMTELDGTTELELAGQKLSYQAQYFLSIAGLQVSWMHLFTSVLPQRSASEVMPASAKH